MRATRSGTEIASTTRQVQLRSLPMDEQRSTKRHYCPSEPSRQFFFLGSKNILHANVTDISSQGVAFISETQIEPGTYLVMEVLAPGEPRHRQELVRVVHREQAADGKWHVGCEFDEKYQGRMPKEWNQGQP
jgi:hypothetical protein